MGKKEVLPPTKSESADERLEELVKNKTLLKCKLLTDDKDHMLYIENGEFRSYPDGFEIIGAENDYKTGILYSKTKNIYFCYDYKKDNEIQNLLLKEK